MTFKGFKIDANIEILCLLVLILLKHIILHENVIIYNILIITPYLSYLFFSWEGFIFRNIFVLPFLMMQYKNRNSNEYISSGQLIIIRQDILKQRNDRIQGKKSLQTQEIIRSRKSERQHKCSFTHAY
jgi:hypothetical protein